MLVPSLKQKTPVKLSPRAQVTEELIKKKLTKRAQILNDLRHREYGAYDWREWEGSDYGYGTLTDTSSTAKLTEKDILTAERSKTLAVIARHDGKLQAKYAEFVDKNS